jgi:hypothetical protein
VLTVFYRAFGTRFEQKRATCIMATVGAEIGRRHRGLHRLNGIRKIFFSMHPSPESPFQFSKKIRNIKKKL